MKYWDKEVRKILLNPYGREALKRFGIDVKLSAEDKQPKELPIVAVLSPSYRAPEPQMQDAFGAMVRYTHEKDIARIYAGPPIQGSSIVHWARNFAITELLKKNTPWTHVLFIDDDICPDPDALERLLSHGKDIIAGMCTRRQDPPIPNIRFFNEKTGEYGQCWNWPDTDLMEVGAVGTGLMLITKNALEQVAQVYFDCLWEQDAYGLSGERLDKLKATRLAEFDASKECSWFRCLPADSGKREMGEDISFCHLARKYCDLKVYVDTKVLPGHIGKYSFSIRDFLPHKDEAVLRAKVLGDYPMDVPDMKISILVPTRGRPENIRRLLDSLRETSTTPPEVLLYVDLDDTETTGVAINRDGEHYPIDKLVIVNGERILMSKMWNRLEEVASGEILMMGGDDIVFKTKGWDDQVRRAFAAFEDRMVFVHGDDGVYQERFGTHGFLHRNWVETVGYFSPPHYAADYNDTHVNEVANRLNRRIYLPFITEHLHPLTGKAEWDKTHKERLERQKEQNGEALYASKAWERERDAELLRKAIADFGKSLPARQSLVAAV